MEVKRSLKHAALCKSFNCIGLCIRPRWLGESSKVFQCFSGRKKEWDFDIHMTYIPSDNNNLHGDT